MPRTFSLARLLLAISLFCILCGLAWNFPEIMFGILLFGAFLALFAAFIAPTALTWLVMARLSRNKAAATVVMLAAALYGVLLDGASAYVAIPALSALLFSAVVAVKRYVEG